MKKFLMSVAPLWGVLIGAVVEKPIVVIIPSYNNERYVEKNLNSVYDQEYDNYRVIYINDCSKDRTFERVKALIAQRGQEHRTVVIHNEHNCGAMANWYHTIHDYCADDDIVVQLDGDDSLRHPRVLARVNQEYSDKDIWLSNGRYISVPKGEPDTQRCYSPAVIQRCAYREVEQFPSHLRTCYAGLFKHIRLQDFLYQGDFLCMTCDMAILFPCFEMAGKHIGFIDEILYEYNCANPLNEFRKDVILQLHLNHVLRSRPKYEPLVSLERAAQNFDVDVLIIKLTHEEEQIASCKADCMQNIQGLRSIDEISAFTDGKSFLKKLKSLSSDFVLIMDSSYRCKKPFDITACTKMLEQTKAHVFCCDRGEYSEGPVPPLMMINRDTLGWQFCMAEGSWRNPFEVRVHIYAKETLKKAFEGIKIRNPFCPLNYLNSTIFDNESVGLCNKEALFEIPQGPSLSDSPKTSKRSEYEL